MEFINLMPKGKNDKSNNILEEFSTYPIDLINTTKCRI